MPYWCTDCRSYFSVRTGTPIARSNVPMRKWAIAIYLCLTNAEVGFQSMKLSRDIGVKQATAWFMLHRIREAWTVDDDDDFDGPVEVDETYFGGASVGTCRRRSGQGDEQEPWARSGKTAVVGVKDRDSNEVRAEVVQRHGRRIPSRASSASMSSPDATDLHGRCSGIQRGCRSSTHEAVNHTVGEYVRGMAHTNGIESVLGHAQAGA